VSELEELLGAAARSVPDPGKGLPDPVFRFVLKMTPMINVDLLLRNGAGEHLLAWREDPYGKGWHVPGGIIRFNETIDARIEAVAREELGATVRSTGQPVDVRQFFHVRGHFISLLYLCDLVTQPAVEAAWYRGGEPQPGQLAWIRGMPRDIYAVHAAYSDWLTGRRPPPV
jgi:ADP-ribose pyrophosphatase YjhB (NUDIX family)